MFLHVQEFKRICYEWESATKALRNLFCHVHLIFLPGILPQNYVFLMSIIKHWYRWAQKVYSPALVTFRLLFLSTKLRPNKKGVICYYCALLSSFGCQMALHGLCKCSWCSVNIWYVLARAAWPRWRSGRLPHVRARLVWTALII